MKAVAYCRVSTNKEEQLDSLESQRRFFAEYVRKQGDELVRIYADEGKSGTKLKNRLQLLKLLSDAKLGHFELVLIKDVSRLARNTLDFLTSIRSLKSYGIKVIFVNYDQTTSDSSEFMLTMLSAIAQEESANTSKRIKFGKRQNAEQGRVPNLIYGYDKDIKDYFTLNINEREAATVRRIFTMYTNGKLGTSKIARILNQEGIKTKRGCSWSQNGVSRILTNEIYIGKIVNGKQEVEDFLTGRRRNTKEEKWLVTKRLELKIIEEAVFDLAQHILEDRQENFNQSNKRISDKHIFSQLIKCSDCGATYRRKVRTYKNTYITWVCNGRNSNGATFCKNATVIDEQEMLDSIKNYFISILSYKPAIIQSIIKDFNRQYQRKDEIQIIKNEYTSKLIRLERDKQKYMFMYTNDIITMEELKEKTNSLHTDIEYYQSELNLLNKENNKKIVNERELVEGFIDISYVLKLDVITNEMLRLFIRQIEIDEKGKIDVYIKSFFNC